MKFLAQTVLKLWPKIQNRKWKWKIWFLKFFRILWSTLYLRTKYEGSTSNRSRDISKSRNRKWKTQNFPSTFTHPYSVPTYQKWRFYLKRFKSYDRKSKSESESENFVFANVFELYGPHCTYVPNMKVLRRADREILAKVETESGKPKISRQLLLIRTRYPYTKNEVSSSIGSKVMNKSPKTKVKLINLYFSNFMVNSAPSRQI